MKAIMYNFNIWVKYRDEEKFVLEIEEKLKNSGFTVINKTEHYFPKQGYTGLWLLAESHCAIHSFPEEDKIYIEISSCVKRYFDKFVEELKLLDE
ncbi:MAG: S-adenosylmethionine decarboxylase [Clostridia bacterium]|nr:S-adenosylmethionine decarboxylase [Clostridia bacterium]